MQTLYLPSRKEWRDWLKTNHASQKEIWLVYYKSQTGKPSIPYEDSVEEALCFGWIDNLIKKLDNERYARKFTLRTNITKWSQVNIRRVKKVIAENRMTEIGLVKIPQEILAGGGLLSPKKPGKELAIPAYLKKALMAHNKAWEYFASLAPSHRRDYILWIDSAKKEETRVRRINEAIDLLSQNKKLGLK